MVGKVKWLLIVAIVNSLLNSPVLAKAIVKKLSMAQQVAPLAKKQGYLLVYVNVDGVAPSIEFSKVKTTKTDVIVGEANGYSKDYRLDLKQLKPGFYLVPMFSGIYQITRVNAPFYDLPYWLGTGNKAKWRFAIEANKVNFIGEIFIAKERGTNNIDVHLLNRVAKYYPEIKQQLAMLAEPLPLALKMGYQDPFLQELEK